MHSALRTVLLVLFVVLGTLLLTAHGRAANLLFIEFGQVTYESPITHEIHPRSTIGTCTVEYEAGSIAHYLNVRAIVPGPTAEPFWIVRNLYLHEVAYEPPVERVGTRFPLEVLGIESGMIVPSIEFGFTVTPDPVLDADAEDWALTAPIVHVAPVLEVIESVAASRVVPVGASAGTVFAAPFYGVHVAPAVTSVNMHAGCTMPNVELDGSAPGQSTDVNGCMPAACANSLQWLRDKHRDKIKFNGTPRDTYRAMSNLMNRTEPKGVDPRPAMKAKLDFIEAHGLPVHVKYQDRYGTGSVASSTGKSSASDAGAASTYPTKAWLQAEADRGEDVEVTVSYLYESPAGTWHWDGGHAVVLTGMGTTAGKTWMKYKHDRHQKISGGTEQEETELRFDGEKLLAPGMNGMVEVSPGVWKYGHAVVTSAISESLDESVPALPGTEPSGTYCEYVKRTVPAGGSIEFTYPDASGRCFNATLYRRDRTVKPERLVRERTWNFNRGATRRWVNTSDVPVTVQLHNDDYSSTIPYPSFGLGVKVNQPPVEPTKRTDPSNPETYGGFSIGGRDGSSDEFADTIVGTHVAVGPFVEGSVTNDCPGRLGGPAGAIEVLLHHDIPVWNPYWERLRLVVDVLEVVTAGWLVVDHPATAYVDSVLIGAPGRFEFALGVLPPVPTFDLFLRARPGLEFVLDGIGVPSEVAVVTAAEPPTPVVAGLQLSPGWPNPFNPNASLSFTIERDGRVDLSVFDVRGRHVATICREWRAAGTHVVSWDGRDEAGRPVASGTYVCRLSMAKEAVTQRLVLVR